MIKFAKDLKKWIADVNYALGIYKRENVFWRLKCFKKYSRVRKVLVWNRKARFISEASKLVQIMKGKEDHVVCVNEQNVRGKFWKLWLESRVF